MQKRFIWEPFPWNIIDRSSFRIFSRAAKTVRRLSLKIGVQTKLVLCHQFKQPPPREDCGFVYNNCSLFQCDPFVSYYQCVLGNRWVACCDFSGPSPTFKYYYMWLDIIAVCIQVLRILYHAVVNMNLFMTCTHAHTCVHTAPLHCGTF